MPEHRSPHGSFHHPCTGWRPGAAPLLPAILLTALLLAPVERLSAQAVTEVPVVGGPCEGCEAVFSGMPDVLASAARIIPDGGPGEPMVLWGIVTDGTGAPAAGVVVYAYHTDHRGVYPPTDEPGLSRAARRHGGLRGWAMTDEAGRYEFRTIRPAGYPGRGDPAHVHMHVVEPGCCTYWIDSVLFDDDPRLTPAERERREGRGGEGIVRPRRDGAGAWRVRRDIRLGHRVPGHPGGGA